MKAKGSVLEHQGAQQPSDGPRPGDLLAGKYRVEAVVGRGGMGVVLAVRHVDLDQPMAIKLMLPQSTQDEVAVTRFLREARAAAGLQSEHVVRIFDVGTLEHGAPYMVMELLRGEDLAAHLEKNGPLPVRVAVDYILQACHAVAEAHEHGIVHRDLKPSNLFLTRHSDGSPHVKVLDFGISKALATQASPISQNLTSTTAVMGSPLYMSPEQIRNAKHADVRGDVWSLGMILYEILAGTAAFHADTLPAICAAIIADPAPPLRSHRDDIPEDIEVIVACCLEKDVTRRFQSVLELMDALRPHTSSQARETPRIGEGVSVQSNRSGPRRTPASAPSDAIPKTLPTGEIMERHYSASRAKAVHPFAVATRIAQTQVSSTGLTHPPQASTRQQMVMTGSSSPLTSSHPSAARPTRTRRQYWVAVGFLGVVLMMAAAAITLRGRLAWNENTAPSAANSPSLPRPRASFELTIDSNPNGAEVTEATTTLGRTPLKIVVNNAGLEASPRKLSLRHDGYMPYGIVQGASEENVHIFATLSPAPPSPPKEPAAPAPAATQHGSGRRGRGLKPAPSASAAEMAVAPAPSGSEQPAPSSSRPAVDIRLQR